MRGGGGWRGGTRPRTCSFLRLFLHVVTSRCQHRFVLCEGRGGREVGGGGGEAGGRGDKREVSGVAAGGGGGGAGVSSSFLPRLRVIVPPRPQPSAQSQHRFVPLAPLKAICR